MSIIRPNQMLNYLNSKKISLIFLIIKSQINKYFKVLYNYNNTHLIKYRLELKIENYKF